MNHIEKRSNDRSDSRATTLVTKESRGNGEWGTNWSTVITSLYTEQYWSDVVKKHFIDKLSIVIRTVPLIAARVDTTTAM